MTLEQHPTKPDTLVFRGHPAARKKTAADIPDIIAGALMVSRGTAYDMMREALAERYAGHNPLGGPAKVFDAMASAIRAGDEYNAVLRQYGFVEIDKYLESDQVIEQRNAMLSDLHALNQELLEALKKIAEQHGQWNNGIWAANIARAAIAKATGDQ